MDLKRTSDLVKHLLQTIPATRSSDDALYLEVCKARCRNSMNLPFGLVIANRRAYDIPPFESVRRSRQKIQAKHPELAAMPNVEAMREVNEEAYRDYARKVTV